MSEISTIRLRKELKERIKKIGRMGDSYDDIIEMLLDMYESKNRRKRHGTP